MKKNAITLLFCFLVSLSGAFAQSKANDIPVSDLPSPVKQILVKYVEILNSETLDDCASKFTTIAGGNLVNPAGSALRSSVKPYSLKKDFQNIKFYKQPIVITRVNKSYSNSNGYGASALKGTVYKIWIAKKDGQQGLPAPISIIVPDGHPTIKAPKVVTIGSL